MSKGKKNTSKTKSKQNQNFENFEKPIVRGGIGALLNVSINAKGEYWWIYGVDVGIDVNMIKKIISSKKMDKNY